MAGNYPISRDMVHPYFNLPMYVAIYLEEAGFPQVTWDDHERLRAALNGFLFTEGASSGEPEYVINDWPVEFGVAS